MSNRPSAGTRRLVAERADFRCEYCKTPAALSAAPYSGEHITPRSQGGSHEAENLAFCCLGCNGHKAAKTKAVDPATRQTVSLFNPRLERWSDHFVWADGGITIQGRTPTGRATVAAMLLNRVGLRNLRRLMLMAELHPSAAEG